MAKKKVAKKKLSKRKKQAASMNRKGRPILSAAVFCNAVSQSESGKTNCQEVFTSFLAWAYPTSYRSWFAILTLYNLPLGKTNKIVVSISKGQGKKTTLAKAGIKCVSEDLGSIINIPLRYKFESGGLYTVHFNVARTTKVLKIPLNVATRPWPKLTKQELNFLQNNPLLPHSIRMVIKCSHCPSLYTFEENVLAKEKLENGVLPFPGTGLFKCNDCGHKLQLKDIQGQLRSSIKMSVIMFRKRGR